jgi:6-phosphofructokinase 1
MAYAVMTSGGDCAGMNPAIKEFVDYALMQGEVPYLVYNGLEGLIDDNIKQASYDDVAGIMHNGGTMIGSSRSKRFFEPQFRKQAYENLQKHGIDKIVILGGDGSFRALKVLSDEFDIGFVGVPSTIDNDIYGTDYCLGVDTALNIIRDATDAIKDTSSSFRRACVVETMGRDSGYLAAVSAVVSGAEVCIIPELKYDLESIKTRLKHEIETGRNYVVCIVAEGTGMTHKMVEWLEHEVGIETRATILGHIQRGGNPTVHDRLMAAEFVKKAFDHLRVNQAAEVIVYRKGEFEFVSIDEVTSGKKALSSDLVEMIEPMTR